MAQKNAGSYQGGRQQPPPQQQQAPRRPVAEWRLGLCKIACWENQTEQGGVRLSFSLTRSYKDGQGQWQQSGPISLNRDDLALVMEVCRMAYAYAYAPKGDAAEG